MEINIIVVCATCIIITFFVYMLLKDKQFNGGVEYDLKSGKIIVNKDNTKSRTNANIVSKSIEENKEFIKLIIEWKKEIIIFLLEKFEDNHIAEKTQSEFYYYVNEIKLLILKKLYEHLKKTNIKFNIKSIENDTYIQRLIRDTFYSVYEIYKTEKKNTQFEALKIILLFLQDITLIIYERFLG